ncbi:HET-domain-containing protein [Lentithecium fluviatile CBS 122367]|uniref:HET-domain-containing protein n=1 Tax=Lentithecium fluviatile CBS 122367 TaxID=1168545 RepID=A0A6G1IGY9_9PLEO|nr:HET-domain-containing protein [Lentithecium fluviatile CBS 122367]
METLGRILSLFGKPFSLCIVFGLRLIAGFRRLTRPKYQYQYCDTSKNQIRVVRIFDPYTSLSCEPVRCSIRTVSLDDWHADYRAWEDENGANLPIREKLDGWQLAVDKDPELKQRTGYGRFRWSDYVAVSYTWGSVTQKGSIILDGRLHSVPKTVELALRSWRAQFGKAKAAKRGICLVWLDYLCIDQEDMDDKARQLLRMQTIYRLSYTVVIHLGADSDKSNLAIDLINKIAWNYNQGFDYNRFLVRSAATHSDGSRFAEKKSYAALRKLFGRPYWRRLWIIQELSMASDLSLVICGNRHTALQAVRIAAKVLMENTIAVDLLVPGEQLGLCIEDQQATIALLWWIGRLREQAILWPEATSVTYFDVRSPALSLAQWGKATYDYDRVFGILSLLPKPISQPMEYLLAEIPPSDKRHSSTSERTPEQIEFIRKVFAKFAVAIIRGTGDLDVIFARNTFQSHLSTLRLPSWVTDLTLVSDRGGVVPNLEWHFACHGKLWESHEENQGRPLTVSKPWDATLEGRRADGGRRAIIEFLEHETLFGCKGIMIGRVDGIAPEYPLQDSHPENKGPRGLVQPQTDEGPYQTAEEIKWALLRTLLFDPLEESVRTSLVLTVPWFGAEADELSDPAGTCYGPKSFEFMAELIAKGWDGQMFLGFFLAFEQMRRHLALYRLGGKPFKEFFPTGVQACSERPAENDFIQITANLTNRRFVTTSTGHFGMAPSVVRPGDRIFVIVGCSIPVILRKQEDRDEYEVVGECYVDGFMKGEAMHDLDSGKHELMDLIIC